VFTICILVKISVLKEVGILDKWYRVCRENMNIKLMYREFDLPRNTEFIKDIITKYVIKILFHLT